MLASLVFASCKKEELGADIDTKAAMQEIMEAARAAAGEDVFIPVTIDGEVSKENCENKLGLTPEQFEEYAMDAYYMQAGIGTQAFEVVLAKCKDYASAKEAKSLAAKGYDPKKLICALPEQCFAIESGRFLFIGFLYDNTAEIFLNAFKAQFETEAGETNKFYERGDEEPEEGGLGGLLIPG